MTTAQLNTPNPVLPKTEQAASQIFEDVNHLAFLNELPTKKRTYRTFKIQDLVL